MMRRESSFIKKLRHKHHRLQDRHRLALQYQEYGRGLSAYYGSYTPSELSSSGTSLPSMIATPLSSFAPWESVLRLIGQTENNLFRVLVVGDETAFKSVRDDVLFQER